MLKVASYGFLKSKKMRITTSKTWKRMKLKLRIEQRSRHQVLPIDKMLQLSL